jgi:Fe2+ transport system protein FeoA
MLPPETDLARCPEAERHCQQGLLCDGDYHQARQRLDNRHEPTVPLCMVMAAETVKVVRIQGESRLRKRLADLGVTIGESVRVVQGSGGTMILAVKNDTRLGIGRDIARQIWVMPGVGGT